MNILYLGLDSFPYGLAEVQKSKLLCMGLIKAGCNVTVIVRRGAYPKNTDLDVCKIGSSEGVDYIYSSGTPFKSKNFITRNLLKTWGWINETLLIIRSVSNSNLDAAIVTTKDIGLLTRYWVLSKVLNFRLVLMFMEYNSEFSKEKFGRVRVKDWLFEKYGLKMIDAVLPISDLLIEIIRSKTPNKPYMKLPVLCDYSLFKPTNQKLPKKYFLFCGAVNVKLISIILESFDKIATTHREVFLYLVVNGPQGRLQKLHHQIDKMAHCNQVKTFSGLPYQSLIDLYLNAIGLIIPIRPTLRDIARFPHKIGEYSASGNPIITTNFGEPKNYFTDNESALICERCDAEEIAKKLTFVLENPTKAHQIGINGREIGIKNFDYIINGANIKTFIEKLR